MLLTAMWIFVIFLFTNFCKFVFPSAKKTFTIKFNLLNMLSRAQLMTEKVFVKCVKNTSL